MRVCFLFDSKVCNLTKAKAYLISQGYKVSEHDEKRYIFGRIVLNTVNFWVW